MDQGTLARIKLVYRYKTFLDNFEFIYRYCKEKIFGFDASIFEKSILYYKETRGISYDNSQALCLALDKERHKKQWFTRQRKNIKEIMGFYQEVDIYPFRQPYLKRFGGFRWYLKLIRDKDHPSVLEYGCGSAVLTEWLISRFPYCQYAVADIPSVTLDFVKWKKLKFNYGYEILTIGPGREGIPLKRSYDLIICQDVLEHTPNPLQIVMAFVDNLSPGGILVVDFNNSPGGENLIAAAKQRELVKDFCKKHLFTIKAIDQLNSKGGLYIK